MSREGPMVGWLVAVDGPALGRALRVGEPRMLTTEGWFEAHPPETGVLVLWWDNGLVVVEDRQAPLSAFSGDRKLGVSLPEPLLVGDEFIQGQWRWRVVEMPAGTTPDPDVIRQMPMRPPLGADTRVDGTTPRAPPAGRAGDTLKTGALESEGMKTKRDPSRMEIDLPEDLEDMLSRLADDEHGGSLLESQEGWFIGVRGLLAGQALRLNSGLSFGRAPACDVVLNHESLNRRHAVVEVDVGRLFIVSMRGGAVPYVNGERVTDRKALGAGDRIDMGDAVTFRYWLFPMGAEPGDEAVAQLITRWAMERAEREFLERQGDSDNE